MISHLFVSIANAKELVEDRIKFKFYCAKEHLGNLIQFQQNENFNSSFESRVRWEAEIECLLSQLIGSKDALLMVINEKLKLEIPKKDVNINTINQKLNSIKKGNLLDDLNCVACSKGSWFWVLNDIRNDGMHRSMININIHQNLHEDVNSNRNSSDPVRITFLSDPDQELEIIPYLVDRIQKMKNMIEAILSKEPILKN